MLGCPSENYCVAPLTRSVDWNFLVSRYFCLSQVAPLTRSVDWNRKFFTDAHVNHRRSSHEERGLKCLYGRNGGNTVLVAPLTRSVDWNRGLQKQWHQYQVAPLTRSVDWNPYHDYIITQCDSRSSHEERGLKCIAVNLSIAGNQVAPLTRSVDWNLSLDLFVLVFLSRSSHEERGLKSPDCE